MSPEKAPCSFGLTPAILGQPKSNQNWKWKNCHSWEFMASPTRCEQQKTEGSSKRTETPSSQISRIWYFGCRHVCPKAPFKFAAIQKKFPVHSNAIFSATFWSWCNTCRHRKGSTSRLPRDRDPGLTVYQFWSKIDGPPNLTHTFVNFFISFCFSICVDGAWDILQHMYVLSCADLGNY